MVTTLTHLTLTSSAVVQLGLLPRSTREQLRGSVEGLRALAGREQAVELRLAVELAWLKQQDPAELGYPSFAALCREQVEWRRSWIHAVVRLVESPLDLVKRAALEGRIPLRVAVHAPGMVSVDAQEAWLADPKVVLRPRRVLQSFEGEDAVVVREARSLGRLLIGREATEREVDDTILAAWRERTPAEQLLAAARTPPPPPAPREALDWSWFEGHPIGEAWSEPRSPAEALERVEAIQAILRGRRTVVAKSWACIHQEKLWVGAGFASAAQFASEVLGLSLRSAQRLARVGRALEAFPDLEGALHAGLSFGAAHDLAPVLHPESVPDWIGIAERVGRRELVLAVREARVASSAEVRGRYVDVIEAADAWSVTPEGEATTAGPLLVALPHPEPPASGRPLRAPAELPEASRWLLGHVRLAPRRGFAAVKTRDAERCQNPECGRRSLCNQAHHVWYRLHGGPDDPANGVTVCRACHLRAIHTGRVRVERLALGKHQALLWTYPGRQVIQLRAPSFGGG